MLIILRKPGEAFSVGSNVIIRVILHKGKTRIAIHAPRDIVVLREECTTAEEWAAIEQAANAKGEQ